MKTILKLTIILTLLFKFNVLASANDYKYVRTYDANGRVIETAKYDFYISVNLWEINFLGKKMVTYGSWVRYGDTWCWSAGPEYEFIQYNNGWEIWGLKIGNNYTEYLYIKQDLSIVRMTEMAGGNGNYREYVRAKRPTIDRLAPTRN